MGDKGARRSRASGEVAAGLAEALTPLGAISTRAMFGGHGIFCDGVMFALVDAAGTPFLRGGQGTPEGLAEAGGDRHGRMPYWSIPPAILGDQPALLASARAALGEARAAAR